MGEKPTENVPAVIATPEPEIVEGTPAKRPTYMLFSVAVMDENGTILKHLAKAHAIPLPTDFSFAGTTIEVETQFDPVPHVRAVFQLPI